MYFWQFYYKKKTFVSFTLYGNLSQLWVGICWLCKYCCKGGACYSTSLFDIQPCTAAFLWGYSIPTAPETAVAIKLIMVRKATQFEHKERKETKLYRQANRIKEHEIIRIISTKKIQPSENKQAKLSNFKVNRTSERSKKIKDLEDMKINQIKVWKSSNLSMFVKSLSNQSLKKSIQSKFEERETYQSLKKSIQLILKKVNSIKVWKSQAYQSLKKSIQSKFEKSQAYQSLKKVQTYQSLKSQSNQSFKKVKLIKVWKVDPMKVWKSHSYQIKKKNTFLLKLENNLQSRSKVKH